METEAIPVVFDIEAATRALKTVPFAQDAPDKLAFCRFDIPNRKTSTRLILAINHHGGEIHVRVDVVTADCPTVAMSEHEDLYHLGGGDFHHVQSVDYDERFGTVIFNMAEGRHLGGLMLTVNDSGFFTFRVE